MVVFIIFGYIAKVGHFVDGFFICKIIHSFACYLTELCFWHVVHNNLCRHDIYYVTVRLNIGLTNHVV